MHSSGINHGDFLTLLLEAGVLKEREGGWSWSGWHGVVPARG